MRLFPLGLPSNSTATRENSTALEIWIDWNPYFDDGSKWDNFFNMDLFIMGFGTHPAMRIDNRYLLLDDVFTKRMNIVKATLEKTVKLALDYQNFQKPPLSFPQPLPIPPKNFEFYATRCSSFPSKNVSGLDFELDFIPNINKTIPTHTRTQIPFPTLSSFINERLIWVNVPPTLPTNWESPNTRVLRRMDFRPRLINLYV